MIRAAVSVGLLADWLQETRSYLSEAGIDIALFSGDIELAEIFIFSNSADAENYAAQAALVGKGIILIAPVSNQKEIEMHSRWGPVIFSCFCPAIWSEECFNCLVNAVRFCQKRIDSGGHFSITDTWQKKEVTTCSRVR